MIRRYLIFAGIIFTTVTANAQSPTPLSLKSCMEYAMKHNYMVRNAQVDVLIQEAQIKQTLSAAYPHINGKAELDDFYVPQSSFIDASTFPSTDKNVVIPKGTIVPISFTVPYAASAGITTSQVIFDGGVLIAIKARNTLVEFSKLNGKVTEETVKYNVYKAYNSLVIAYRQFDIIKSSLVYARSLEHDVMVTRDNGFAEKIDVERTSVQVNNLSTDSMRIGNLLAVSEQLLKYQMGMDLNTPIVLTDTVVEERKLNTLELLNENERYENVPEYNVATTGLSLNEYNLKRYQYAGLPSLSGFWSYGANYGSNEFRNLYPFSRYWSSSTLGLQLNIPIFNGLMRVNQVAEARLNIEKSVNNVEFAKQSIDFQAATSRTNLKNAVLETRSQRRNMELSDDVLDLARRKYKAGVGSNLEVTQAQTDQLRAETNYFNSLLDIINAEADLKKALGLL